MAYTLLDSNDGALYTNGDLEVVKSVAAKEVGMQLGVWEQFGKEHIGRPNDQSDDYVVIVED